MPKCNPHLSIPGPIFFWKTKATKKKQTQKHTHTPKQPGWWGLVFLPRFSDVSAYENRDPPRPPGAEAVTMDLDSSLASAESEAEWLREHNAAWVWEPRGFVFFFLEWVLDDMGLFGVGLGRCFCGFG